MAGTTTKSRDTAGHEQGAQRDLLVQFNKVIDDLEKLRAGIAYLTGSATYDPASLVDAAGVTTTVTVTGAAVGDFVQVAPGIALQGIIVTAWVSAADTVSVRYQNESAGTIDLASHTIRVRVSPAGTFTGAASDMTAAKIGNSSGTPITS